MSESAPAHSLADGLVEAGWLLAGLLTPLAVNLWGNQPFDPFKAALLRSLVWMMAAVWIAGCLLARRRPWNDLRDNPLLWPTLALAGVCVLATVLGADRGLSLWGSYERSQGLLTLLSYALLLLVCAARLRTRAQAQRLMGVLVATGVPLVCVGVAQALGWQPLPLVSNARSQVGATLGRSNFLGAYLAMVLPLTLAWAWTARRRWLRVAGVLLALAELAVIGLTLSRGAWLAAGVALGVLAGASVWPRLRARGGPWPRLALAAAAVGVLAIVLVGAIGLARARGGSDAARVTIWRATAGLIARRPALGYGPEALGLAFPRVYPPELVYYMGRGEWVDRAHNLVLDWLATAGILGLAALGVLLAAFGIVTWRAARGHAGGSWQRAWLIACLAAVAGNVAGDLVSFDVTATATLTALVMALAVALARRAREPEPGRGQAVPAGPLRSLAAGLVIVAAAAAVVAGNVRPAAADIAARRADLRAAQGDWPGAAALKERAASLWPVEPAHRRALSYAYLQVAGLAPDPLPWLERAEAELQRALELRPGEWLTWAAFAELYRQWGNRWDRTRLALAHAAYGQTLALAPNVAMLHASWGLLDLEAGQFADAAARFRRAVELDATDGYAFWYLGEAEWAQGHTAGALAAYQQAVHWQPDLVPATLGLARCYWQLGRRDEALEAVEQALQLDPGSAEAQALRQEIEGRP